MQMSTWACDHQFTMARTKIGALFQFVSDSMSNVLLRNNVMTRYVSRGLEGRWISTKQYKHIHMHLLKFSFILS